jgi:hypothetical protein
MPTEGAVRLTSVRLVARGWSLCREAP